MIVGLGPVKGKGWCYSCWMNCECGFWLMIEKKVREEGRHCLKES